MKNEHGRLRDGLRAVKRHPCTLHPCTPAPLHLSPLHLSPLHLSPLHLSPLRRACMSRERTMCPEKRLNHGWGNAGRLCCAVSVQAKTSRPRQRSLARSRSIVATFI